MDEWKLLIQLSQQCSNVGDSEQVTGMNGSSWSNGSDCGRKISPESLTLMLARTAGPDRAMAVLEELGVQLALSPHSQLVCELLRVTEKRQRWVTFYKNREMALEESRIHLEMFVSVTVLSKSVSEV